jgi:DNA repair protein RecO (recombination protein O)
MPVRGSTSPAIVLRTIPFGESDKIVTLLSRDAGKITGIAKGAKRSRKRFGAALEIFCHIRLDYRERRGSELAFLERAVILRPWSGLVSSLERYVAATHVVEVADKMSAEREVGCDLYDVVVAALERLERAEPCSATLRIFELAVLAVSGYGPDFSVCVGCSGELQAFDRGARLHVPSGGLLCSQCAGPEASGILLGPESIDCLHRLSGLVAGGLPNESRDTFCGTSLFSVDENLEIDSARHRVASELRLAVAALIEPHLRSPLRSLELMSGI